MFRSLPAYFAVAAFALLACGLSPLAAQEQSEAERFKSFAEMMQNVKLQGSFTIAGRNEAPKADDAYVIKSVRKIDEGDYWVFDAVVKHDGKEMPLQIPIEVKWSGDTPVITLENLTIPSLGTFSARIVLYRDAYAGLWVHGNVKGHMYGTIEKLPAQPPAGQNQNAPAATKPEEKKP